MNVNTFFRLYTRYSQELYPKRNTIIISNQDENGYIRGIYTINLQKLK